MERAYIGIGANLGDRAATIARALDLLAERHGISFDLAFAALRQYSRNNNRRLSDVALAVTRRELEIPPA